MVFCDCIGEFQSSPAISRLCRKERLEQTRAYFIRYSRAIVLHFGYNSLFSVFGPYVNGLLVIRLGIQIIQRILCVTEEIEKNLLELVGVTHYRNK